MDIVKYLLEQGANCKKFKGGNSVIHEACQNGNLELVKLLLDSGVYVQSTDHHHKSTPLITACNSNSNDTLPLVKLLVDKGAEVNHQNIEGVSPLAAAVSHNNYELVEYLITQGATVNIICAPAVPQQNWSSTWGQSILWRACAMKFNSIVELLLKHAANPNLVSENEEHQVPLHAAAKFGDAETIRILVAHGANVNIADSFGRTPMHVAARRGNADTLQVLLECGADKNLKDTKGDTPYEYAKLKYPELAAILQPQH